MKRRDFIKRSALASTVFLVPGFVRATEAHLHIPRGMKRLVIVQLEGGNDGLNTIVPYTNDIYYRSRPGLAIKSKDVLRINDEVGFHKGLKALRPLFDNGELSIINQVGYANPNRSHFRSTDIWHTASAANKTLREGWIGRYLDKHGKSSHDAIEIGNQLSLMLKGKTNYGLVTRDAKYLSRLTKDPFFTHWLQSNQDQHLSEHNMGYLYQTMVEAKQSARYIREKTSVQSNHADYGKTQFNKQLATIAQFINSGLETKVYFASLSGFDTHANQSRTQPRLLEEYATAMSSFVNDLKKSGRFEDTLILTFSEFGRRVAENAAVGTDHGAANNVFVIGSKLNNPGLYNAAPDLKSLDDNGDLIYEVDFRQIYANLLESWLGVENEGILDPGIKAVNIV